MAVITVRFNKNRETSVKYPEKGKGPSDAGSAVGCTYETALSDFEATAATFKTRGTNTIFHIIQSWGPEESKKLTADQFNEIGRKMVMEYLPDHQAKIDTHTETGKTHNHIMVNMINMQTGKKLENKKYHLYRLREISDKLCLENGLSVIQQKARERRAQLPEAVKRMEKFNRRSYIIDTMQKADFGRKYATSYDEYRGILGELGIKVKIENRNISYNYPGEARSKRGSKLGKKYDKPGLEEAFKKNDALFREHPELRASLKRDMRNIRSGEKVNGEKNLALSNLVKDYSQFTKLGRGKDSNFLPSEIELGDSIIPIDEMRKAKTSSILRYCKQNKIALITNPKGETVLKGRAHVVITDLEWTNTRNRTKGSLIEFVAATENKSFLQAIAKINGNPRLLLLEEHLGEQKNKFTSFHLPKSDKMNLAEATHRLGYFLKAVGSNSDAAKDLLSNHRAEVGKNGVVRLFPEGAPTGGLEFTEENTGYWSKKKLGQINSPFHSVPTKGKKAVVHLDLFGLMKNSGSHLFSKTDTDRGLICVMEHNPELVDRYVGQNKTVMELFVLPKHTGHMSKDELDFFNNLKGRYLEFGVKVREGSLTHERTRGGFDLDR